MDAAPILHRIRSYEIIGVNHDGHDVTTEWPFLKIAFAAKGHWGVFSSKIAIFYLSD